MSGYKFRLSAVALVLALSVQPPASAQSVIEGGIVGSGADTELQAGGDARIVMPAPTGPGRPYRQSKSDVCDEDSQCILPFAKVPANRLLEIQTVACSSFFTGPNGGNGGLTTAPEISVVEDIVAVFPARTTSPFIISEDGHYYFRADERPHVFVPGNSGSTAICTVSGLLYPVGS